MRRKNHDDFFINYRNSNISTSYSFEISSGNIFFRLYFCIYNISIDWWICNFTLITNMIERFGCIYKRKENIRFTLLINWWLNEMFLFDEEILNKLTQSFKIMYCCWGMDGGIEVSKKSSYENLVIDLQLILLTLWNIEITVRQKLIDWYWF